MPCCGNVDRLLHCLLQEENEVVNVQCGIQALNASSVSVIQLPSFLYTLSHLAQEYFYKLAESNIHSEGCLEVVQNLFRQNLSVILGFGIGLLVFQLFNIMLAGGIPRTK